jgi:hypothetical protein
MDLSLVIAWFFPLLGICASLCFGVWRGKSGSGSVWAAGLLLAIVLGIGLTLVQVWALGLCTHTLHVCTNKGDVNIGYWFQSFFCMPLYWASAVGAWRMAR